MQQYDHKPIIVYTTDHELSILSTGSVLAFSENGVAHSYDTHNTLICPQIWVSYVLGEALVASYCEKWEPENLDL